MTVILLDPMRPTLFPIEALDFVGYPMEFTEEVSVRVRWQLGAPTPELASMPVVLVSSDPRNEDVRKRIAKGESVFSAPKLVGDSLIEATALMHRLRSRGGWEGQQTHDSLRGYLLEETYELLDAIQSGDMAHLREELGDILLQVLFHARIAQEQGRGGFDVDDVARGLITKLTTRTPGLAHSGPIDIEQQERDWEERKAAEKSRESCMDGIAMAQPALALAQKVVARATRAGLPNDLIPDGLTVVHIGIDHSHGGVSAEDELHKNVVTFARRIRDTELRAAAAGLEPGALQSEDWKTHWVTGGVADSNNVEPQ